MPAWEDRLRRLSGRFRGQAEILDSDASLQATSLTLWLLNSEGTAIQTGRNYVRVFIEADARAEDGMELERFESFDAEALEGLGGEAAMNAAADSIIADLKALRRAPLAEPYAGPAILEGKAAGVFFHEILRPPRRGAPAEERRGGANVRQEDWRADHADVRLGL